jgi:hypothetical protein
VWSWVTSGLFVVSMPFRLADPVNAVKASSSETSGPRAFASIVLPLEEMRHVSKLLGVTINTLAVSCLAGGLRRHLIAAGGGGARRWPLPASALRLLQLGGADAPPGAAAAEAAASCGVPQSLMLCAMVDTRAMRRAKAEASARKAGAPSSPRRARRAAAAEAAGGCNTLSFIGVPVLTGPAPPLARLAAVGASLEWVRGSLAVLLAVAIPPLIQFFVRDSFMASRCLVYLMPSKTTVGFSNMRGPVKRVMLGGYPVERMYNGGWGWGWGVGGRLARFGR